MRRKIEFHIIKNYPYSCLNRDEFGTPKNFLFAGHPHGRISSQSLKRSWREYFKAEFDKEDVSIRTRALPTLVKESLEAEGKDEEFVTSAVKAIKEMFVSEDKDTKGKRALADEKKELITGQVIPLSPAEIKFFQEEFGKIDLETLKDEKARKKFLKDLESHLADLGTAIDIALWGRMVTSSVIESTEASMQVAHAISTHPVTIEQDIFTAVDDIIGKGAGMYGVAEYDSCCYYEYACLDFDLLVENLGGDEERAKTAIPMLIKTMACSNPSGKITTTATNILPSAMIVEAKSVPYNLANAFAYEKEKSEALKDGVISGSVKLLVEECDKMQKDFGIEAKRYLFSQSDAVCRSAEKVDFQELIEKASSLV